MECTECAGFWLDAGELEIIRTEFKSDSERIVETEKYFETNFAPQLQEIHQKDQEERARAQKIQNFLGILSPSHYTRKLL